MKEIWAKANVRVINIVPVQVAVVVHVPGPRTVRRFHRRSQTYLIQVYPYKNIIWYFYHYLLFFTVVFFHICHRRQAVAYLRIFFDRRAFAHLRQNCTVIYYTYIIYSNILSIYHLYYTYNFTAFTVWCIPLLFYLWHILYFLHLLGLDFKILRLL